VSQLDEPDRESGLREAVSPPKRLPPLLVTAEMPPDVLAWADGLRRAYFPPERNRLPARISGLMKLGGGTALAIDCPDMVEVHGMIAERMHGLLTRQDAQALKLHITIQNKVSGEEARALQAKLAETLEPRSFRFHGLGLYAYEEGLWRHMRTFAFRGGRAN
jgi:2'-5' RNA ligase superfamily